MAGHKLSSDLRTKPSELNFSTGMGDKPPWHVLLGSRDNLTSDGPFFRSELRLAVTRREVPHTCEYFRDARPRESFPNPSACACRLK